MKEDTRYFWQMKTSNTYRCFGKKKILNISHPGRNVHDALCLLVLYEVTFRALHEKIDPSASALKKCKD